MVCVHQGVERSNTVYSNYDGYGRGTMFLLTNYSHGYLNKFFVIFNVTYLNQLGELSTCYVYLRYTVVLHA